MTLTADGTDWETKRRGVPADNADDVPDSATTWSCLERTGNRGIPITLTVYRTPDNGGHITVTADGEREEFEQFGDVNTALAHGLDLMDEYGPHE